MMRPKDGGQSYPPRARVANVTTSSTAESSGTWCTLNAARACAPRSAPRMSRNKPQTDPVEDGWAWIREAQGRALELPHTGMALAIDIGEADDIHPRDKQTVGERLALIARANVYDENVVYSGPVFESMSIDGNRVRLKFGHTEGGLKTRNGGPPRGFAVRGKNDPWRWAEAEIAGERVIIWNDAVSSPQALRYGWASNPVVNLYNGACLPAVPFRTDR